MGEPGFSHASAYEPSPAIRPEDGKAPGCGFRGLIPMAEAWRLTLEGDDPEAVTLRPSHHLRAGRRLI